MEAQENKDILEKSERGAGEVTELILITIALLLLVSSAGMIIKMYLENTEQERQYKKIAKKTRNKRKEFEERKRKQFENNKMDKE